MLFVYLDDFGHVGPYLGRDHPKFNTNPVYGFAGFALPAEEVRPFSSFFIQLKKNVCAADIEASGADVSRWEKKGTNLFTRKAVERYQTVREAGFRLPYEVRLRGGFVFYYGREKLRVADGLNYTGLKTTVFAHTIKKLDRICERSGNPFAIVVDQDQNHLDLLTSAQKTIFGSSPCRKIVSPQFEVKSHLDQNVQAADWIASIVGKLYAHRYDPVGFADCEIYNKYYWDRVLRVSHGSSVDRSDTVRARPQVAVVRTTTTVTVTEETKTILRE